jgi:hypothetical protein
MAKRYRRVSFCLPATVTDPLIPSALQFSDAWVTVKLFGCGDPIFGTHAFFEEADEATWSFGFTTLGDQERCDAVPLRVQWHDVLRIIAHRKHGCEWDASALLQKLNQHVFVLASFRSMFDGRT